MTAASTIKTWYLVHKWTSLVCTLFLLLLCVTGLPLVVEGERLARDDIDHAVGLFAGTGVLVGVPSFVLMVAISALEILVAGIQAYVFALLTSLYINDAENLH